MARLATPSPIDPAFVARVRGDLLRFARLQLGGDDEAAARPAAWEDPEAGLHSDQFFAIFDACLNRLPAQQGRVFMMREVVELATEEICDELGLTGGNIHVILYRARLALRACLRHRWFAEAVR